MKKGLKLVGILFAMTGLLTACGSDDDTIPIIITPTPTITAVAPSSGPPGTAVTITGTNFSTTLANNVVKFNGTTAVVTSSTATQIVTTVPAAATTGFITVARGTKTATSPAIFTVTATPPATTLMGGSIQGVELSLTNAVTTMAGTGAIGFVNGIGTAASFAFPAEITTDGTNLYVADFDNHSIRMIVIATGAVTTVAGTGAPGTADGIGTLASFNGPNGITTDGTNLYVTDFNSHTIRQIVIATGAVTTLAGTAGTAGAADGIGPLATFNGPAGITTDGTDLYVTDLTGNLIRKIVIATGAVTTFAGSGVAGAADGIGTLATFNAPVGITTDGTNLYVTDRFGNLIRQIVIATQVVTTVAGSGAVGSADGIGALASFNQPYGITTDGTNLYVGDSLNFNIRTIE